MANHTIGNKRGSVRGAPPDVYLPFGDFSGGEDDPFEEATKVFGHFFGGLGILVGVAVVVSLLWAVGCIPDEYLD